MAQSNGLNPSFDRVFYKNGPYITGGTTTGSEAIVAQVGTPSVVGSLYISSNGSGEVWQWYQVNLQNAWRQLTVN